MKYYEVEFTVKAPKAVMGDACDLLSALAGDAGFETFEETTTGLKGYVQQSLFDEAQLGTLLQNFPLEDTDISYQVSEAEYRDWNEQWEQEGFEPIIVDNRCVIHDGRHLPDCGLDAFELSVEIDARLAFGTGTHETTRMMVASLLDLDLKKKQVLDCGCGTGILGIVALKLSADRAVGYDIDEWSVENTRHNAVINRVDEHYTVFQGDASVLREDIDGQFDIVLANINRNILLSDMPVFRTKMAPGGLLLLSGFYEADSQVLIDCARQLDFVLEKTKSEGEWSCLSFRFAGGA